MDTSQIWGTAWPNSDTGGNCMANTLMHFWSAGTCRHVIPTELQVFYPLDQGLSKHQKISSDPVTKVLQSNEGTYVHTMTTTNALNDRP